MTISASLSHFLIIFNCSSNFAIYSAKVSNIHILLWDSTFWPISVMFSNFHQGPKIPGIVPAHSQLRPPLLQALSVSSLVASELPNSPKSDVDKNQLWFDLTRSWLLGGDVQWQACWRGRSIFPSPPHHTVTDTLSLFPGYKMLVAEEWNKENDVGKSWDVGQFREGLQ